MPVKQGCSVYHIYKTLPLPRKKDVQIKITAQMLDLDYSPFLLASWRLWAGLIVYVLFMAFDPKRVVNFLPTVRRNIFHLSAKLVGMPGEHSWTYIVP